MKKFIVSLIFMVMFCINGYCGDKDKEIIPSNVVKLLNLKEFSTKDKFTKYFNKFCEDIDKEREKFIKDIDKEIENKAKDADLEAIKVLKRNKTLIQTGMLEDKFIGKPYVFNNLTDYPIDTSFINPSKKFKKAQKKYEKKIHKICEKYFKSIEKCMKNELKRGEITLAGEYQKEINRVKGLIQFNPVGEWEEKGNTKHYIFRDTGYSSWENGSAKETHEIKENMLIIRNEKGKITVTFKIVDKNTLLFEKTNWTWKRVK